MFLIDGYNLLHAAGVFAQGQAAGTLQAEREALLAMLAGRLTAKQRRVTTIVFDAAGAPPGLPDTATHESIKIRYARGYEDADALLEEIIEQHRAPKGMVVVSSDHRVQRAARSRGARWVDSEQWVRELPRVKKRNPSDRLENAPGIGDAAYWAEQFSDAETIAALEHAAAEEARRKGSVPRRPPEDPKQPLPPKKPKKEQQRFGEGIFEGFPPGYGEDLLDGPDIS
ncbi:YacP-like NYN domain protein [Pirellulimonas nuda]|uniref:YacP-like NYN domain protein n=1 Tax=Pirellulimonas nuda TaxID=2528009 RepID=A0A518DAF6_9BACT|nr:NYN domain-containing protein [Pirellulimonas nuda]QDU88465.1 YacP-like NYN domain protein [Pirellulimonas nuda]